MRHHLRKAESETIVRQSGSDWTILQPAQYAQTPLAFLARSPAGLFLFPYNLEARFSLLDVADIAAIASRVLTESTHTYASYELAGPQLLRAHDIAATPRVCDRSTPASPSG